MRTNIRRSAGTFAVLATALGALAGSAGAATTPTATLVDGVVTVTGTANRDVIGITVDNDRLSVDFGQNGTIDARFTTAQVLRLKVLTGAGDDGVSVTGAAVGNMPITINTSLGNDGIGVVGGTGDTGAGDRPVAINAGDGNDGVVAAVAGPVSVQGGAGDDRVDGGGAGIGHETIALGDGNDTFISSLNAFIGTRSDVVDGGAGQDKMEMDGTFATESISLSAKASHLLVQHSAGQIDAVNVEDVSWFGFGGEDEDGGGDAVLVNDLTGTSVTRFTPNFSAPANPTVSNNSADQLTVVGTALDDHLTVSGSGQNITVAGLKPTITPVGMDAKDVLQINTIGGDDSVDTRQLPRGLVQLQ